MVHGARTLYTFAEVNMSRCSYCSAPLLWAETEGGKRIPLDPTPVSNGNIELIGQGKARYVVPDVNATPMRHVTHFSTCPSARQHRKAAR